MVYRDPSEKGSEEESVLGRVRVGRSPFGADLRGERAVHTMLRTIALLGTVCLTPLKIQISVLTQTSSTAYVLTVNI